MIPPYDLVALQTLDLEIDRLEHRKVNLEELAELRLVHHRRRTVESDHDDLTSQLRSLDLAFDRANGELQMMEERLEVAEKRLFGGGMSSKETENRRMEVQSLRERIGDQETEALELMERREGVADQVNERASELEEVRASEETLRSVVQGIWAEIDGEVEKRRAERDLVVAPVPSEVMSIYETLRKEKQGVAAGRLQGATCGGCHLALSESERLEAAESDPPRCPHCRRILVF